MSVVLVVLVFVVVVFEVVVEDGGVGGVTDGVLDVVVWPVLVVPVPDESHELVGLLPMSDAGAQEFDEAFVPSLGVVVVVVELLPPLPAPLHEFVEISGPTRKIWMPAFFNAAFSESLACWYGTPCVWPARCTPSWSIVTGTPPMVAEATVTPTL